MSTRPFLRKVVFIDDDPITNKYHEKLNDAVGLAEKAEFYETAKQLIENYRNVKSDDEFPDLFVVDIGLPQESGHDLGKAIRKLPGFNDEKHQIVFVTASKDIKDVVIADNNQFDHYYWKPLDKRKVKQLLSEAFNIEA
jgi:CheY-like chemotaxis protein